MWHNEKCSQKDSFRSEHLVGRKRGRKGESLELFADNGFKGLLGPLSGFSLIGTTRSQQGLSQESSGEIWAGYLGVIRTR